MDNLSLIESFAEFKDAKNIDRVSLMSIIEESLRAVLRKKYGTDENIDIIVNPDKGDLEMWRNRTVVQDDAIEDPRLQIGLTEARNIEPDFEVGEDVSEEIKISSIDRKLIPQLRSGLLSKVMEHNNLNLFKKFKEMEGEVITGEVHLIRHSHIIIMDDVQNEMTLMKEDMIPSDFFHKGDTVRAVVKLVEMRGNKPEIKISRTSPKFLEKLFEQEIPEVMDGLIMVRKVARIPGEKAKVSVESYDDRIDPVGACVGVKGARIHNIVRELNNENIDVINHTTNQRLFLQRALGPSKPSQIELDEETKTANVFLKAEEISKAIGKSGQNIRLASMLTGLEINVYREGVTIEEDVELREFSDEIERWVIDEFYKAGLDTAKSVLELNREELAKRTDLEEETIEHVVSVLKKEFEDS